MSNLKTISTLFLNHGSNVSTIMLGRLSGLQKLRCIFTKCWDDCNSFPELSCLSRLESLKVCFSGKVHSPSKFSFPANLKKLMLSSFQLPWNEISAIGRFPNLEVLKLLDRAFEEQQWEMNEGEFQNLKFLKLDLLNIITWIVSSKHLPSLEQIVLHSCKHLQESLQVLEKFQH